MSPKGKKITRKASIIYHAPIYIGTMQNTFPKIVPV